MTDIERENLQRLVDGELNLDQTRHLLRAAESNPADWRMIACAMVENQIFQKQFVDAAGSISDSDVSEPVCPVVKANDDRPTQRVSGVGGIQLQHLALAAGLLIALTTGFLVGSGRVPSSDAISAVAIEPDGIERIGQTDHEIPRAGSQLADNSAVEKYPGNRISPASYVEFETPNGEAPQGKVPLFRPRDFKYLTGQDLDKKFDPTTLGRLLPDSGMTDDLRTQLDRSGYQVDVEVRYVSGNLADGSKFVVPMRTIRWSPSN